MLHGRAAKSGLSVVLLAVLLAGCGGDGRGSGQAARTLADTPTAAVPRSATVAPRPTATPTPGRSVPAPTRTAFAFRPPKIQIARVNGRPGEDVEVAVVLRAEGFAVAGIEHEIAFARGAFIAPDVGGRPDCSVNPAINKNATSFAFLPSGCDPQRDCSGVKALVLALDNVDAIPDGAVLYTCRVRVVAASSGLLPLGCVAARASDGQGRDLGPLFCLDGGVSLPGTPTVQGTLFIPRPSPTRTPTVQRPLSTLPPTPTRIPTVRRPMSTLPPTPTRTSRPTPVPTQTSFPPPPPVPGPLRLRIDSGVGQAGELVPVAVRIVGGPAMKIRSVESTIAFPPQAPIVARASGRPDCVPSQQIPRGTVAFFFEPMGCRAGVNCERVRASIFTIGQEGIAGVVVYTCHVRPRIPGTFGFGCTSATAMDLDDNAVSIGCEDGVLQVGDAPPPTSTPTVTPTPPATATGTPTATGPTRTPTVTLPPPYATVTPTPVPPVPVSSVQIGIVSGRPGETVEVPVRLRTRGNVVAGVQNDIYFGAGAVIASSSGGSPECRVTPEIDKNGTVFGFQPAGCAPPLGCEGVRAVVLALDNSDPIADASVLYTCRVEIAADAPPGSRLALTCIQVVVSSPSGRSLAVECLDGGVDVLAP